MELRLNLSTIKDEVEINLENCMAIEINELHQNHAIYK